MKSTYSKEFIAAREKDLLKIKKRVTGELEHITGCSMKDDKDCHAKFPNYGDTEDDNATEVDVYENYTSLETNLKKLLDEVLEALKKIKEGTYGVCGDCNKLIEQKRLEAFPAAPFCIQCESKREKQ